VIYISKFPSSPSAGVAGHQEHIRVALDCQSLAGIQAASWAGT